MAELEGLAVQLTTDVGGLERGFNRAAQAADTTARQVERQTRRIDEACRRLNVTATAALRSVAVEMAGLGTILAGGALTAERVIRYADAWKQTGNQLTQVTRGTAELRGAQDALFAIAQKTRQAYGGVVDLYTRGAKAARELGATQDQLRQFTEGVAMATALSGKGAQEQAGAIQQLGQLLNSTRVQAEEYNSVLDGAPRIAQAVADGLEAAGGSVGKLKRLIDDGKVSNQQFFQALLSQLPRIQAEFAKLAPTMEEAGRVFDNALGRLIGRTDEAYGATTLLAGAIIDFSENLETVAGYAAKAGGALAAVLVARGLAPLVPALARGTLGVATFVSGVVQAETSILRGVGAMQAYAEVQPTAARALQRTTAETLSAAQAAQIKARADLAARAAQYEAAVAVDGAIGKTARLTQAEAALAAARAARTAADEQAAAAAVAHAAATQRAALGAQALTVASRAGAAAVGAFNAVLGALGGWTGIGIMAVVGAVYALATRSTEAEEASHALERAQASLGRSMVKAGEGADSAAARYRALSAEMKAVERAALTTALRDAQRALAELREAADEAMRGAGLNAILNGKTVSPRLRDEVMALVAAFHADRGAASFARLLAQLQSLGDRVGGSAGAALREMALALADSAGKADTAGQQIERVKALLTLLDDPANAAARAVLGLGTAAGTAGTGIAAAGDAAGLSADDFRKAADALRDMAATYAMSEAAKKNFEASKTASADQKALLSALADQVEALDAYKEAIKERDAAEQQSQRERIVSLAAAEAAAVRTLTVAAKLQEAARAVAEGTMTMAAARAMAEREGDAAGVEAFAAAMTRLGDAFKRVKEETKPGKGGGFAPGTNLADFRKETAATVTGLDRMTEAYAKGAAAVEAATRAQEVEQRLLKLGEANRAAVVALVNEEADARQRLELSKWVAETDRQMEAARRLADAELQGVAAVEEANTVNAIAEQMAQQRVQTGTREAGVIEAKVRALEAENRRRRENAALRSAEADLSYARAELSLMGQAEPVRERALATVRAQAQALVEFGTTTSEAARTWLALQEQIADTRALTNYRTAVRQTADSIAQDWTETLFEAMTLQDRDTGILEAIRALLRRIALEFLKTQIVLPVVTQIVGSIPGAFGIQAPGGTLSGAGGAPGGGIGIGSLIGNAGSLSNLFSGSLTSSTLTGVGNWIASSSLGEALGLSVNASGMALDMVGGNVITGLGADFAAGLGASPWGIIGSLGANLLGLGGGIGGTIGGMVGSIGGGIAGSAALGSILGAAGGPVGAVIGAFLGTALGGLFGGKPEYPVAAGAVSFSDGRLTSSNAAVDNGGDEQAARQLTDSLATATQALIAAGRLTQTSEFRLGLDSHRGRFRTFDPNGHRFTGESYGTADEAVIASYRKALADGVFEAGGLVGKAIRASTATELEPFLRQIDLAGRIEDGNTALAEMITSLGQLQAQAKKTALEGLKPLRDDLALAEEAGIVTEYKDLLTRQLQTLLSTEPPPEFSAVETALAQARGQADAFKQTIRDLGLAISESAVDAKLAADIARLRQQVDRDTLRANRDLTGLGSLNAAEDMIGQYTSTRQGVLAVGGDVALLEQNFGLALRKMLGELPTEELDAFIAAVSAAGVQLEGASQEWEDAILAVARSMRTGAGATAAAAEDLARRYRAATGLGAVDAVAAIRAQGAADSALDPAKAAAVAGKSLSDLFDGLGLDELEALQGRFKDMPLVLEAFTAALKRVQAAAQDEALIKAADLEQRHLDILARLNPAIAERANEAKKEEARRRELAAATDDATRATLRHIHALEDQAVATERAVAAGAANLNVSARGNAALGQNYRAAMKRFESQAMQEVQQAMASGQDVRALLQVLQVERARTQVDAVMAQIDYQIGLLERDNASIVQVTEARKTQARALLQSADSLLTDASLSPLNAQERLDEAVRQFREAVEAARGGDLEAAGRLDQLGRTAIEAERAVFASTRSTTFDEVEAALRDVAGVLERNGGIPDGAVAAHKTAQDQLEELRKLRKQAEDALVLNLSSTADLSRTLTGAIGNLTGAIAGLSPSTLGGDTAGNDLMAAIFRSTPSGDYFGTLMSDFSALGGPKIEADRAVDIARALGYQGAMGNGELSRLLDTDMAFRERFLSAARLHEQARLASLLGVYGSSPGHWEIPLPGYAGGGLVTGGTPGHDSVPLLAMPGERVLSLDQSAMLERIHGIAVSAANDRWAAPDVAALRRRAEETAAGGAVVVAIDRLGDKVDALRADLARHEGNAQRQRAGIAVDADLKLDAVVDGIDTMRRALAGGR